jgi:hypothetical protein
VVGATANAESGFVDPVDAERLRYADARDPLARAALAKWDFLAGDLRAADARYATLLAGGDADAALLSDAAAVRLGLGDPHGAAELYRRAIEIEPSALLWFDLSQAHGAAIDVEQHDRALAAAQALDAAEVSELTRRLVTARDNWVAELPASQRRLRARLLAVDAAAARQDLLRWLAPGRLGSTLWLPLLAFGLAGALGFALARVVPLSTTCLDCGSRLCARCGTASRSARCAACQRERAEARAAALADPHARGRRARALRAGRLLGWAWPGFGVHRGRPLVALTAALVGGLGVSFALGIARVLPDPGSVGAAAQLVRVVAIGGCGLGYAALALLAAATGGRRHA